MIFFIFCLFMLVACVCTIVLFCFLAVVLHIFFNKDVNFLCVFWGEGWRNCRILADSEFIITRGYIWLILGGNFYSYEEYSAYSFVYVVGWFCRPNFQVDILKFVRHFQEFFLIVCMLVAIIVYWFVN